MNSSRAKILFLVSTLRQAGPTTQLLNLVRYMDRERFDPVIVTLSAEPADSMRAAFEELQTTVTSLSLSRVGGTLHRGWRASLERVAGGGLDARCLVHSQGIRADIISASELAGLARVSTARNYPYDDYVMKYGRLLGRWMAHRHLQAFRSIPVVVACSSNLERLLRGHGLEPAVIRNGVDTSKFAPPSPSERARLRAQLNLPTGARVGLCVGSLVERKDPLSIVRAVRASDAPELVMMFVGTGTLDGRVRREAEGDPRIRFTGQVGQVLPYFNAADFLVSASRSEGMPNSALEALACGLPVVLSDIEPHRELLELAPSAGTLFALGDLPALVEAIRRAASPATASRGLSPGQAAALLGAEQAARRYQELYLRLMSQGASTA
jgi:glycosyltransferase involved in cell wall biosynthesis